MEAGRRSSKMSIQGVQPKLSARLSIKSGVFELVDQGGTYILKPPHPQYSFLPQNEDLCMRLAAAFKIDVPLHGLIYAADGSLTYFIRRFDRYGRAGKRMLEDFAQLSGLSRETKYDSSMERVVTVIDEHCTFPILEKIKLFRRLLFCYIAGNEDMHLKNFSLLGIAGTIILSPAYDMVSTALFYGEDAEELALPLRGKKKHLTKNDLLHYFAKDRLGLSPAVIKEIVAELEQVLPVWAETISASFLPESSKEALQALIGRRAETLVK